MPTREDLAAAASMAAPLAAPESSRPYDTRPTRPTPVRHPYVDVSDTYPDSFLDLEGVGNALNEVNWYSDSLTHRCAPN